jgi:hypothetical protein
LNLKGSTQPEIYKDTVDAMIQALLANSTAFWRNAEVIDGPMEIWEIDGDRWVYNVNHRYQAALQIDVEIPDSHIQLIDRTGSLIPTWRFDQMIWLAGKK